MNINKKKFNFDRRKKRLRSKLSNVSTRNRLSIFKSNRHIHAQIIDDRLSKTLVYVSTLDVSIKTDKNKSYSNLDNAVKLGKLLADKASKQQIKQVSFDKGGNKYHGVVKAFADAARSKLDF